MGRNTLAAVAVLGAVTLAAGTVVAQQAGGPKRWDKAAIQAEIGLSDEQAAGVQGVRSAERTAEVKRRGDMRVARMELNELLSAPTLDEGAIGAKVTALANLQAAAVQARAESQVALRRLVTADQYQKLQQVRMRHGRERGWRMRGSWRHSGPAGAPSGGTNPQ